MRASDKRTTASRGALQSAGGAGPGSGKQGGGPPSAEFSVRDLYASFDLSPGGELRLDDTGGIVSANSRVSLLLDVPPQQLVGRPFSHFLDEQDRDILHLHLRAVFRHRKDQRCEFRMRGAEGNPLSVLAASTFFREATGQPRCRMFLFEFPAAAFERERDRLLNLLSHDRDLLQAVIDHLPSALLVADADGHRAFLTNVRFSQLFEDLAYQEPKTILEELCSRAAREDGTPYTPEEYPAGRAVRESRVIMQEEMTHRLTDGTLTHLSVNAAPLRNVLGETVAVVLNIQDISDRKEAERRLRESEAFARNVLSTTLHGLYIYDIEKGTITFVNPRYTEITGYTLGDLRAMGPDDFLGLFHPKDRQGFLDDIEGLARAGDGVVKEFECRFKRADEEYIWCLSRQTMFRRDSIEILGAFLDITDRKRMEKELERDRHDLERRVEERTSEVKQLEERLRLIADTVDEVFWIRDPDDGRMIYVSPAYEKVWGRPVKPLFEDPESFLDTIHPDDLSLHRSAREELSKGMEVDLEYRIVLPDGTLRWIENRAYAVRDENGRPAKIVEAARDVTQRKKTEIEMEGLNEELRLEIVRRREFEKYLKVRGEELLIENKRRKRLSGRLVDLLERERKDIASALHDDVGMVLTTTSMELESLKNGVEQDEPLTERIRRAQEKITEAMEYVRDVSRRLRPDILDHLGLVSSIRNLIDVARNAQGPRLHLFTKGVPRRLERDNELAVYRIAHEALTNALRHARAKNIFVNLIRKDAHLLLSVEDDGIGFDAASYPESDRNRSSLGVVIMRERAHLVGGSFEIESQIGKGTHVLVHVPLD